jgi:hypothetical protein
MARNDWISVGIQKDQMKKIDEFLKTEDAKKLEVSNRQQMIALLVKEFLQRGTTLFEQSKEIESLQTQRNTAENMLNMVGKGLIGSDDFKNFKHIKTYENKTIIRDETIKKSIEIIKKDELPYCSYHKATWCDHIGYIFFILMMNGMENLSKGKK